MISPPSMCTAALHCTGLVGLAAAWEDLAAAVGALVLGLAIGTALRFRRMRRDRAVIAEGERELESVRRIASELARTSDVEGVARALLDEIAVFFSVDFVGLTFVSEDGGEAFGFLARSAGRDVEWWRDLRLDLLHERSGIATVAREASGFAVYDVVGTRVLTRLAEAVGAKSAAYVPLIGGDRVIAVISVATTAVHRVFSPDDLRILQTPASAR